MGLSEAASASVHVRMRKLIMYGAGGPFYERRDTVTEAGMFASMIVQLPAKYTGGTLAVHHRGQDKKFLFDGPDSANRLYHAVFFADVFHALAPIESGTRLWLTYDLVRAPPGPPPSTTSNAALIARVAATVIRWTAPGASPTLLTNITFSRDHHYTDTNLRFAQLKGRDRAVVEVLKKAGGNRQLLDVHLVMLQMKITTEETWWGGLTIPCMSYRTPRRPSESKPGSTRATRSSCRLHGSI
ncbi:hypothetical protein BDK51DRAFT_23371 [Blyttiomyces helicus]|uniref:Prolyl 4-hydroxylase alpha subunit Fe(2+) 2OG dioxygenase domain-containing protein n=1 Tax=Blyttiomyces helicus TaxID=388810 RepID=A0A4P9WF92_9FUNG|nr:hypothetical protein BDK51DRAFT_23371 [Blyttiomyces helicus]|eukprot:RKO89096.1 hypothetical protein BDK51DRAFT_23371 [Blyttiomyces helicus]